MGTGNDVKVDKMLGLELGLELGLAGGFNSERLHALPQCPQKDRYASSSFSSLRFSFSSPGQRQDGCERCGRGIEFRVITTFSNWGKVSGGVTPSLGLG